MNQTFASHMNRQLDSAATTTPHAPNEKIDSLDASQQLCRRIARSNFENFHVTSILLPRKFHQHFYNVYAFCRTADDAADESASVEDAVEELGLLRVGLDHIYKGEPSEGLFPALASTIHQFGIQRQPFDNLLSAFIQDQSKTRYASFKELRDYSSRSADPVGHIVLKITNAWNEQNAKLSDSICTGLQLANFWQDVARDYSIGRVYLPRNEMERFGVVDSMLGLNHTPEPLKRLIQSECDRAERFFQQGLPIVDCVPKWLGRNLALIAAGGLATLQAIRQKDYEVLSVRPIVSKWTQAKLLLFAFCGHVPRIDRSLLGRNVS